MILALSQLRAWIIAGSMSVIASTAIGAEKDPGILQVLSGSGETIESYGYQDFRTQFPERELTTRTPWTLEAQPTVYRGPALKDVLVKAGLGHAKAIRVIAYNDFQAVLTLDEIDEYRPILAIERGCTPKDREEGSCAADQQFKPLDLDDTGPFSIIWPYDELPQSATVGRNFIWVWFVTAIRPEP